MRNIKLFNKNDFYNQLQGLLIEKSSGGQQKHLGIEEEAQIQSKREIIIIIQFQVQYKIMMTENCNLSIISLVFSIVVTGAQFFQQLTENLEKKVVNLKSLPNTQTSNKSRKATNKKRTKDIIPNIFRKLKNSYKISRRDFLSFQKIDRPREWTPKHELILLCLKYLQIEFEERQIFREVITKICDGMIIFRQKKININEKIQRHIPNLNLLIKVKKICLKLLKKETMPQAREIHSILTQLMEPDGGNEGTLAAQTKKINPGFQYILRQFPIYSVKNEPADIPRTVNVSISPQNKTYKKNQLNSRKKQHPCEKGDINEAKIKDYTHYDYDPPKSQDFFLLLLKETLDHTDISKSFENMAINPYGVDSNPIYPTNREY